MCYFSVIIIVLNDPIGFLVLDLFEKECPFLPGDIRGRGGHQKW